MQKVPKLRYHSRNGQCAIILLAAIRELKGAVTKREATDFIYNNHWFAIEPNDEVPYPSQEGQNEPRWHNMIAWGRKECVLRNLISDDERDNWEMTRFGRDEIDRMQEFCRKGKLPVEPCYLWSADFKRFMNSSYNPNPSDAKRPLIFYQDMEPTVEGILKRYNIEI